MSREHSPQPGVTWQQQPARVELVVEDGPWGGPVTITPWDSEPEPKPIPGLSQPAPLNREQRRALKRAGRKRGRK